MGKREWSGLVGQTVSWSAALLLLVGFGPLGCGSDPAKPSGGSAGTSAAMAGEAGAAQAPGSGGGGSDEPATPEGGDTGSPVTPGDLVCSSDEDCRGSDKPVCDQVQGCVACQYDWDCPANHRCKDNECFEKQACTTSSECDATHPVCDAVQQLCVGCRESTDCADGERCEASECVAFEACVNSRDCAAGKVCDRSVGACVGCVNDGDCGEGSACVQNACVPTCESDKDCLGIGLLCNQQVGRCMECLAHADCPAQYYCAAGGTCLLDVCETGQTRCETEQLLSTCSEAGDAFASSSCASNSRCVEADQQAACVPHVCAPAGTSCSVDGAAVVHCSADGLSIESTEPCLEGKACNAGACVDVICPPGEAVCVGTALYDCSANGTEQTFVKYCQGAFGGTCNPDTNACEEKACYPEQPMCDGNIATICAEDGVGPEAGGIDCAEQDQVCYAGTCRDVVCEDEYVCQEGILRRCQSNGTVLSTVKNCGYPALCDAAGAKCITPICTPNAFVCDGSVATRCKADGSGYVAGGQDCTDSDMVCDGGGCLPSVCTPNDTYCSGGSPVSCGPSGATYTPLDECTSNEYCAEGSSYCLLDKCTAGAAVCSGNLLTTCASDGSGPLPGGTNCAADGKTCENGACVGVVCTPQSLSCQGEAVYQCNGNGTGTTLYDSCLLSEYCDASGESPACTPDVCTGGALGCDGEVVATCGSNGGSWTSPGTNCKSTSQVCILGGSCAAQESAVQGSLTYGTTYGYNPTILGAFRTLSSRKLTKLEAYLSFAGLQKLTWVVYEKRAGADTYDLVYQKVTSQTMETEGVVASPALDFVLQKGKTYALGVHVTSEVYYGYQYYGSNANYVFKAAFLTGAFASSASGDTQPATSLSLYSSSYKPYLQLTTVVAP